MERTMGGWKGESPVEVAVYVWLTLLGNVFGFLAVWALRRYFASVSGLHEAREVVFGRKWGKIN